MKVGGISVGVVTGALLAGRGRELYLFSINVQLYIQK